MRRLLPAIAALIIPVAIAACGDDDPVSTATAAPSAAANGTGPTDEFNESDVLFAQQMIPHHQQAVEMAEIALGSDVGARADIVDLATRIQQAQAPEIDLMTGWLGEWGQPSNPDASGEMASMDGMMTDEEMDELRDARRDAFDRMWLEMMIAHHEGAIAMAETEQDEGSSDDAISLAGDIIAAQRGEIDEMNQLLAD